VACCVARDEGEGLTRGVDLGAQLCLRDLSLCLPPIFHFFAAPCEPSAPLATKRRGAAGNGCGQKRYIDQGRSKESAPLHGDGNQITCGTAVDAPGDVNDAAPDDRFRHKIRVSFVAARV